jgi:hypothetical protein
MDDVDAILFALLALGDIVLIAYLRRRRQRRMNVERMGRSLRLAIKLTACSSQFSALS